MMLNLLEKADFFSLFGLQDAASYVSKSKRATYSSVSTELDTGAIRTLLFKIEKTKDGYDIKVQYLYHDGTKGSDVIDILNINCLEQEDGKILIQSAAIDNKEVDLTNELNVFGLLKSVNTFFNKIGRHNEWINPVKVLDENNLASPRVGRKSWPGLYVSGNMKSINEKESEKVETQTYPYEFLGPIMGVGPASYANEKKHARALTLYGKGETGKGTILKYQYERGRTYRHIKVKGYINVFNTKGMEQEELYNVEIVPGKNAGEVILKSLEFMGRKINLDDPKASAAILKVIRNMNRMIRAGDQALIDDLKKAPHDRRFALPTELMLYTKAFEYMNEKGKFPSDQYLTFHAVGGNNLTKHVSKRDTDIGANQYMLRYKDTGIMIDTGILFHDVFSVAFYNPARYLKHKYDKSHQPDHAVQAIMYTHRHQDHLGQLAYLVRCGYEVPALIMNRITRLQMERELSELKVDKKIREEIFSKCYVIDPDKQLNKEDTLATTTVEIAGTKIVQGTEALDNEATGQTEYYPILQIGDIKVRVGPMPHSDPGFMYDIITPIGSHRHTGDWKNDPSILLVNQPSLETWLKGHKPTTMSMDSTGGLREGKTPDEKDIQKDVAELMNANPEQRFIFTSVGSNLARLTTLIAAMGQTERKTLIVDGLAVERLLSDARKVYDIEGWAMKEHGVRVLSRSRVAAKEILEDGEHSEYALLVTGTQDEAYSSLNRAVRDWLPDNRYSLTDNDIITFLQGPIPVGYNAARRLGLAYEVEKIHGARVLLPELIKDESDLLIAGSGHASKEDTRFLIKASGNPIVIPVHGGPEQLKGIAALAHETGAKSMVIAGAQSIRISDKDGAALHHIVPTEFVGVTLHTPGKDKFYLKGDFSTTVIPVPPPVNDNVFSLVAEFERNARNHVDNRSEFETANILPVSLSPTFNFAGRNNFLLNDMPFGAEKYHGDVFSEKYINVVAGLDTETTGLDPNTHRIREFALGLRDVNGNKLDAKQVKKLANDAGLENFALETKFTQTTQVFQKVPDYILPSPMALLVTRTNPNTMKKGKAAHHFLSDITETFKTLKTLNHELSVLYTKKDKAAKAATKMLVVAHNAKFDNRFIAKEFGRNLDTNIRPHQVRGSITLDTRILSRTLAAYCPGQYNVVTDPNTKLPDHTLRSLCLANGLPYSDENSHGGLADVEYCLNLFFKQKQIAPDLIKQQIVAADSRTKHLLNDMVGRDTGFGGPHPVFSYVSPIAERSSPQMGCFIGTLDSERYVVVFNLKYDPEDYLHLPTDKIMKMLKDRKCDVFEIMDLKEQPIVVPAKYGLKVKASGDVPKETLDRRAAVVKRHINYVDGNSNWQNLAQKMDEAWQGNRDKIFRNRFEQEKPDLHAGLGRIENKVDKADDGILQLLITKAKLGFNPLYQKMHQAIREYLDVARTKDHKAISGHYHDVMRHRSTLGSAADVVNNVHYDIRKSDLTRADKERVEFMRRYQAFLHYHDGMQQIKQIEEDPAAYLHYIGDDVEKKKLFEEIKKWYAKHDHLSRLSENELDQVHPWRQETKVVNTRAGVGAKFKLPKLIRK